MYTTKKGIKMAQINDTSSSNDMSSKSVIKIIKTRNKGQKQNSDGKWEEGNHLLFIIVTTVKLSQVQQLF